MKLLISALCILSMLNGRISFCQNSNNLNGIKTFVTNSLGANATQALRYEIAQIGFNSHHWQYGGITIIELFADSYSPGYAKYYLRIGYGEGTENTAPTLELIECKGINKNARIEISSASDLGSSYVGYPNKAISVFMDVRYYSGYHARLTYLRDEVSVITDLNQISVNASPTGFPIPDFSVNTTSPQEINGTISIFGTGLDGSSLQKTVIYSDGNNGLYFDAPIKPDGNGLPINFAWRGQSPKVTFLSSGNVDIGTTNPGSYKLNVAGSIRADAVVCNTTGADFVFEPTYKLRPLAEVETFIKQNKHLPNIAPAAEMQTNGLSMGEMQAKLLEKVEELSLYVIEQNTEIKKLKEEINQLKK